jgi:glycosyltransferase involved in cell wall biosynthesis
VVAASLAGRPSVWALHEVESWKWLFDKCQPGIGAAMNLATTLLVTCQYAANMYNTWQPRDMRVIYHGVKLRPLPPPKPPGSRPLKVLLLASIHPRKGQDIGIEAMKKIGDKGIQLDIVGIVVDLKFCSKLLDMTHGFPPVRWIGEVPAGADIDAIAEADIVIVPSRDDVTPMVIAEAMGMGKPVIAANIGGIPEMVQDGETGLLMEKEDSSKLAELIEMLAGDEGLRRTYGERGREFIKNHRTIEVFGREVGKMIEETLAAFED